MVSRDDVLSRAADDCMKELYSLAQPSIDWEDFKKECETYSKNIENGKIGKGIILHIQNGKVNL